MPWLCADVICLSGADLKNWFNAAMVCEKHRDCEELTHSLEPVKQRLREEKR